MGKGNRNSQQRLENKLTMEEKNLAKEKARRSKKTGDRWVAVACIVLAVLVVSILVLNVLAETGVFLRATDAISIGDGKEVAVNSAMMTFFVNDYMTSWYNQYYVYVMYGMLSIDMSGDLHTQKMTSTDASYMGDSSLVGTTWYDYFMDTTVENVEMYVTYAYLGRNIAECALTDEDYNEIDETMAELKAALKENQMSFADQYGRGVSESDVRACYELIERASKFGEYKKNYFEEALEKDDSAVEKYPEDNKGDFYTAKYLSYSINISEKTEGSQEKYDQAVEDAKAAIAKIEAAKTPADFTKLIELYKKSPSNFIKDETGTDNEESESESETSTKAESKTEAELSEEELMEKYTGTITWQTGDELGDWIFEETADVNDKLVVTEESTEVVTEKKDSDKKESSTEEETKKESNKKTYEKFKITVYMLIEQPTLDHTETHNIAYLISDNKEAAQKLLDAFKAGKDKTRDEFVRLAEEHYDALHAGHDHSDEDAKEPTFSYSKVDRAKELYFADDYDLINDWIDDDARVDGSYTEKMIEIIVTNSDKTKTTYYAVVLFEGHDVEAWYSDAFNGTVQKQIDEWYKAELDKKLITYNWNAIDDIL